MKELTELRAWLASKRGDWSRISRRTELSTKTISRIVNDESYNLTFQTYMTLDRERQAESDKEPTTA